jgi:hypothetical protein
MKFTKTNTLLFGAAFALAISACEEPAASDSIITNFAPYTATLTEAPVAATECDVVHTLNFTFDNNQNTDITLQISVGESSSASEETDFELLTHEIDIPAYAGQDTFSVDIAVYQDFEIEDGNESIYLTFKSDAPSGVSQQEVLVADITDSGIGAAPGETTDLTVNWFYADNLTDDACANDMDVTIQAMDETDPYAGADLLGYEAASVDCPEEAPLTVADMVEGEVYNIWVVAWGADVVARDLTVTIDYARANSSLNGTLTVAGIFNSTMAGDAAIVGTIENACNTVTIKDTDGNVVAEGRANGSIRTVKVNKPSFKD